MNRKIIAIFVFVVMALHAGQTQPNSPHKNIYHINGVTIYIVNGNLVTLENYGSGEKLCIGAIVNAANKQLARGGGVCGAIFGVAEGADAFLQDYINFKYPRGIETGKAVVTPSFNLKVKHNELDFIIHAVGPIYNQHTPAESQKLLKESYLESLVVGCDIDISSVAFPFISSGIYGYPKPEAALIALQAFKEYAMNKKTDHTIKDIYMVLDKQDDYALFIKQAKTVFE